MDNNNQERKNKLTETLVRGVNVGENGVVNSTSLNGNGAMGAVEGAKKVNSPQKKIFVWLMVVLGIVVLAAVGLVAAGIWGAKELTIGILDPGKAEEIEKPEEEDQDELVEVSLDDKEAKRLYGEFENLSFTTKLQRLGDFYTASEVAAGTVPDVMMLDLVMTNAEPVRCKMNGSDDNLKERYESWTGSEYWTPELEDFRRGYDAGCFSGEAMRNDMKRIFGKDIKLTPDMLDWESPYYGYSEEYDEIYSYSSARGGIYPQFNRELEKAERQGQKVYFYERVGVDVPGANVTYRVDSNLIFGCRQGSVEYGTDSCKEPDGSQFSMYKWTFRKNEEGNYVFERLEKVKE